MKALRCACNSINVTQYTSKQFTFILKQGYMFRLGVNHLQAITTFSLPDALPTLGSLVFTIVEYILVKSF